MILITAFDKYQKIQARGKKRFDENLKSTGEKNEEFLHFGFGTGVSELYHRRRHENYR
jgi:hypothetical protein